MGIERQNDIFQLGRKVQLLKSSIKYIEELIDKGDWELALEIASEIKISGE